MSLIGYARVSTAEGKQLLDRQIDALKGIISARPADKKEKQRYEQNRYSNY